MILTPRRIRFLLLSGIFLVSACGHRPHRVEPGPWESAQNKTPVHPEELIIPSYPKPTETPPPPRVEEVPRVALVLGGAGVASFATVGLLKKLQEEKIKIDLIVTTGWPTLFVLGKAFLPSIHELEWFATRLTEKDFYKASIFDERDYASHEKLGKLIEGAFKQREIQDGKIPIVISAANTEFGEAEIFDRGDWREPLLKTMSVPGLFRPYPADADRQSISSLQGLDVDEAHRRGLNVVVAVYMYDDYLRSLSEGEKNADALFRRLYQAQLRKSLGNQLKLAQVRASIELFKAPNDFNAKRTAILAGYREGERVARSLRALVH
ncbi:MAG: hypothetical protein HYR96_02220 [Deltaproteobacteria bacterium]|nr:hypothetical protein [Deltaproteobacteria bacterium]MBI3293123.1 hypothetical protein [Deltaproteobacteria bacterium]